MTITDAEFIASILSYVFRPDPTDDDFFAKAFGYTQSPNGISKDLQPEKALMLAVLNDAISVLLSASQKQYDILDARKWIFVPDDEDWPFSFVNVCYTLGVDSSYVRKGVKLMVERG